MRILGISLNPGPFTVKEHVLITIMATVGYTSAYAVSPLSLNHTAYGSQRRSGQTDIIAVQRVFYNQIFSFGYQWMVVMSTQLVCLCFPPVRSQ